MQGDVNAMRLELQIITTFHLVVGYLTWMRQSRPFPNKPKIIEWGLATPHNIYKTFDTEDESERCNAFSFHGEFSFTACFMTFRICPRDLI